MKSTLRYWKLILILLPAGLSSVFFTSCDDEDVKTVPTVTTGTVTNITGTTATVSGEIVDNGNTAGIIVSGFVYSTTNSTPTLADSKTEETATDGTYSSDLVGLTSSSEYHVRAYATNSQGTGYGATVNFTTGNAAPVASNVVITGTIQGNMEVTVAYDYDDAENDVESGTTIKWYRANDATGAGEIAIAGATEETYTIQDADEGKFLRVGVTPKAATGTTTGSEVKSPITSAVGLAITVTFIYNGEEVTYGILTSTVTSKRWMDRNLGAPNTPSADNDWANYGDLFQWGRAADGHQLITRASTTAGSSPVNGTTTTLSTTDTPADSKFIIVSNNPVDWRSPQNGNLWQAPARTNNPCPSGWHVPTEEEWIAEDLDEKTVQEAYTQLKITRGGQREVAEGLIYNANTFGGYWSSTIDGIGAKTFSFFGDSEPSYVPDSRAAGYLCRCIKD